jgi:hypothetical protein
MPASIKIELENGETIQSEKSVFDGFHSTPMSWDHVRAKFDRLTDGKLDKGLGREISAIASDMDTVSVKQLTALPARVAAPWRHSPQGWKSNDPVQRRRQLLVGPTYHRKQQSVGELPPYRRSDLRHLFGGAKRDAHSLANRVLIFDFKR